MAAALVRANICRVTDSGDPADTPEYLWGAAQLCCSRQMYMSGLLLAKIKKNVIYVIGK